MVTSKYKVSDRGLTLKIKFREKNSMFVIKTIKDINDCLICDIIRPGAKNKLTDSISNKYVSDYIVYFPNISKHNIYMFL